MCSRADAPRLFAGLTSELGARTVERYPSISEQGLSGDLQTAALVTTDSTIDFFCCPRFDSPSIFA
jgi:hypothetical protein